MILQPHAGRFAARRAGCAGLLALALLLALHGRRGQLLLCGGSRPAAALAPPASPRLPQLQDPPREATALTGVIGRHAGADGGVTGVAAEAAVIPPQSLGIHILEGVFSSELLEAILSKARQLAESFSQGPDSVDGQPSCEFQLIDEGRWLPEAAALQELLAPALAALVDRIHGLEGCGSDSLLPFHALIRRYAPGERREHPVHYDHKSMVTGVCSLTPPSAGSGLYVQHGPHAESREFVDLRGPGNFVVHGWDLAHGVEVRGEEDRYSMVLFLKPEADVVAGTTSWYRPLAAEGNVQAAYRVGMDLENLGRAEEARELYQQAADGGHWVSMHRLGGLLQQEGDLARAIARFEEAAGLGYAPSQVSLGDLLSRGSVPPEGTAAAGWYTAAAEQGHPAGQHRAGLVQLQAGREEEGEALLLQAARRGWADAQFMLGRRCRQRGQGGLDSEAASWFRRAADQGHPGAMNQLAVLAAGAEDFAASRQYLQDAARRGHAAAMSNLALYLERGIGGVADPEAAAGWRAKAAAGGGAAPPRA